MATFGLWQFTQSRYWLSTLFLATKLISLNVTMNYAAIRLVSYALSYEIARQPWPKLFSVIIDFRWWATVGTDDVIFPAYLTSLTVIDLNKRLIVNVLIMPWPTFKVESPEKLILRIYLKMSRFFNIFNVIKHNNVLYVKLNVKQFNSYELKLPTST